MVGKSRIIEPWVLIAGYKRLGLYSNPRHYIQFSLDFIHLFKFQAVSEQVRSFVWLVGKGRKVEPRVLNAKFKTLGPLHSIFSKLHYTFYNPGGSRAGSFIRLVGWKRQNDL